ncbi:hypothetical protein V6K52_09170 [Knoellia sp. S7-12]|uniref:hypothetical protein n=1 Tax=Knoellia sp. S7-12 TaxID=3126698 RepID=UPI0033671D07
MSERFDLRAARFIQADVAEIPDSQLFDAACIDPPWYGRNIENWLRLASSLTRPGGVITLALLGELTRPDAAKDRVRILKLARSIGETEIYRDEVTYDIPLFEWRALEASGLVLEDVWRRADLVVVRNERPAARPKMTVERRPWREIRIGDHTASVRSEVFDSEFAGESASAAYDALGTLDSVSQRHPSIERAHIWSCENRLIVVHDAGSVIGALEWLSESAGTARTGDAPEIAMRVFQDLFGGD